jgi:hypothetical protein
MNQPSSKPTQAESPRIEPITLDFDHILTHAGGDPALLMQLCSIFLNELPMRMQYLHTALKGSSNQGTGRALEQLRNCLIVFGSGPVSVTAELLEAAVRGGCAREVQRELKHLEWQLQILVPQVQRLMLEMAVPKSAVQ